MPNKGTILLIPNTLGESSESDVIPIGLADKIGNVNLFLVENPKHARRLLIALGKKEKLESYIFITMKNGNDSKDLVDIMEQLNNGKDVGIISDAGCPAIADPGSEIVKMAHINGIRVQPLTGPSSILLALMASGFNGQNFAFNGYLPVDQNERKLRIREFERSVYKNAQTQIFIETPYRNNHLLVDLFSECQKKTKICLAVNLTLSDEWIRVETVENWKTINPDIHKKQCIFLIYK